MLNPSIIYFKYHDIHETYQQIILQYHCTKKNVGNSAQISKTETVFRFLSL